METKSTHWTSCPECQGRAKKSKGINKKARETYQAAIDTFEKSNKKGPVPIAPQGNLYSCSNCNGTGLIPTLNIPTPDTKNYPTIAIIGGGIGGIALAIACMQRAIPFTLYERDNNFEARSQGYGLTLQQATKAIQALGIFDLKEGVISTKHLVHTTDGQVIGEWGNRKWMQRDQKKEAKRTNIHIARQSLRLALLEQLGGQEAVKWGHQLIAIKPSNNKELNLQFEVNGQDQFAKADLIVGADGIRSTVRKLVIGDYKTPLRYLDCIVILGICTLQSIKNVDRTLLDSATVFQTANGNERIYIMPYDSNSVMWQLSFPMLEDEAKALSALGPQALKDEASRRTLWHDPIPQIIAATQATQISGYPVYDRELLKPNLLENIGPITLIGDAAHPMSPFKGQGANQALLDAVKLAREITKMTNPDSPWREKGIRETILKQFEADMLERTAVKVKDSAAAAQFLHTKMVLHEANQPRRNIDLD